MPNFATVPFPPVWDRRVVGMSMLGQDRFFCGNGSMKGTKFMLDMLLVLVNVSVRPGLAVRYGIG